MKYNVCGLLLMSTPHLQSHPYYSVSAVVTRDVLSSLIQCPLRVDHVVIYQTVQ